MCGVSRFYGNRARLMKKNHLNGAGSSFVLAFAVLACVSKCAGAPLPAVSPGSLDCRTIPSEPIIVARGRPTLKQGAYRHAGGIVYVGIEAESPDHPTVQFYDEKTGRTGTLEHISDLEYRTDDSPTIPFMLDSPIFAIEEKAFVIETASGRLGASLWCAAGVGSHPTIILIHGADDETREMGFLIPYFVSHGLNVVAYDQRGTGISAGNWRFTGPDSKADDVIAVLKSVESDPAVDSQRIGVWGFSNGGWVAPIVATRFPLAFMILKSPPSVTGE